MSVEQRVVVAQLGHNKLNIKATDLLQKNNPVGRGKFVYVAKTRFYGVKRNILWMVIDGQAYPLNGATKGITPNLPWPREAPESTWKKTGLDKYSATKALELVFVN